MELINMECERRKELLNFLTNAATADCEADLDSLIKVFHPSTERMEMGIIYRSVLGYDPITIYDHYDILSLVEQVMACDITEGAKNIIRESQDNIVEMARSIYEDDRMHNLGAALVKSLKTAGIDDADVDTINYTLLGSVVGPVVPPDDDEDDDDGDIGSILEEDDDAELDLDDLGNDDDDDLLSIGEDEDDDED